jgi:hypothetical protein
LSGITSTTGKPVDGPARIFKSTVTTALAAAATLGTAAVVNKAAASDSAYRLICIHSMLHSLAIGFEFRSDTPAQKGLLA